MAYEEGRNYANWGGAGLGDSQHSLEPYLKRSNIFIKGIDTSLLVEEILQELLNVCPRNVGRIVTPTGE